MYGQPIFMPFRNIDDTATNQSRSFCLPLPRHSDEGKEERDNNFLVHNLFFNCNVPDDESTLTIALLKVEGGWRGVKRLEGEDEVGEK